MTHLPDLSARLRAELTENILPFWMTHVPDREHGGFHGAISNTLEIDLHAPRAAILCARILWTFSAAYRRLGASVYLDAATWAYTALTRTFWDMEHGGVYWTVDRQGVPVMARKHAYAQAFAIYGLSEYYRATQHPESKALACRLFELLEAHAFEPVHGGYIEGCDRDWGQLEDMRLSDRDLNSRKSMNTLLHILEAYTNLLQIWEDDQLRTQHRGLLETFLTRIFDPATGHLRLFFDDDWTPLTDAVSYGHDIEASWLLWEATQRHTDSELHRRMRALTLTLAENTYREGRDADGSLFYEGQAGRVTDDGKAWWPQAEALVGFTNAYQLTGEPHFAAAVAEVWRFIETTLVDRVHGDWFKQTDRAGVPDATRMKASIWDCPYHHSRACFEMLARLSEES